MTIKVLSASTGQPIPGARVRLRFANAPESRGDTDNGGTVSLAVPSRPGPTTVLIERRGYQSEKTALTAQQIADGLSVRVFPANGRRCFGAFASAG